MKKLLHPEAKSRPGAGIVWLLLALGLVAARGAAAERWWNDEWQCMRKFDVTPLSAARPGAEAVHVSFTTGGYLQPEGRDLRVVTAGEAVGHKVVWVGPGDQVSLLFEPSKDRQTYEVYYGNPNCDALETTWSPQRGLVMETRRYQGGNPDSLAGMRDVLKRAGAIYGRGLVDKVWHGANPFGPSPNIVSTYSGWLLARQAGLHEMVTSSASASFMLIDDKLAVEWAGWHGAIADARIRRAISLTAGAHKFTYYHVQGNADPIMVAAWRTPGMKTPEVIPLFAFLPPRGGRQTEYRLRGETFAPDFTWRNADECQFDERYAVTMRFTDTSFPRTSGSTRRLWDFGDGLTSKEAQPTHVFMATGTYVVSLTVSRGDRDQVCRQKVVVDRDWAAQQTLKLQSPAALAASIANLQFEEMTAAPLLGAALFYKDIARTGSMLRLGNFLLKKLDQLEEDDLVEASVTLGTAWRDEEKQAETALRIFLRGEELLKQPANRARLAVLAGDTLFYHLDKPDAARAVYERVRKGYPQSGQYVRLAIMRLGDIARRAGRLEEARHYYRKSHELRPQQPAAREAVNSALRALETEDLYRRGEYEEVGQSLHLWQWQEPEEKLRGQWSALMIKMVLKKEDLPEAVKEAETLIRVNPESQYVPEILLLLSEARAKQKQPAAARAALEKLQSDYPDSPLAKEAAERLKALGEPKK